MRRESAERLLVTLELFDADGNVGETVERFVSVGEPLQVTDAGGPLCRITIRRPIVLPGGSGREVLN